MSEVHKFIDEEQLMSHIERIFIKKNYNFDNPDL